MPGGGRRVTRGEDVLKRGGHTRIGPFPSKLVALNLFQGPCLDTLRRMPFERNPCVYILSSKPRGTLYIGVTSDLTRRLYQHREGVTGGFTSRYEVRRLVRFEMFDDMENAILREKRLKRWHRQWKINLVEQDNPQWIDLAIGLGFGPLAPYARRDGS